MTPANLDQPLQRARRDGDEAASSDPLDGKRRQDAIEDTYIVLDQGADMIQPPVLELVPEQRQVFMAGFEFMTRFDKTSETTVREE